MEKSEIELVNRLKKYVINNRSFVRVGGAIFLIFIGFSASHRFARIASGGFGDGIITINSGFETGFKVALVTLGIYLLIKDLIIEVMMKK